VSRGAGSAWSRAGLAGGVGERGMPRAAPDQVPAEFPRHRKRCHKRSCHGQFPVFCLSPVCSWHGLPGCVALPLPRTGGRLIRGVTEAVGAVGARGDAHLPPLLVGYRSFADNLQHPRGCGVCGRALWPSVVASVAGERGWSGSS